MKAFRTERFFRKAFRGGKFDFRAYKREYAALFAYLAKRVLRLNDVVKQEVPPLTPEEKLEALTAFLDERVAVLFAKKGVAFGTRERRGGMSDKERKALFTKILKEDERERGKEAAAKKKPAEKLLVPEAKKAKKAESPVKAERKNYRRVERIAEYELAKTNEDKKAEVLRYVAAFSTDKKPCIEAAAGYYIDRVEQIGSSPYREEKKLEKGEDKELEAIPVDYFNDFLALRLKADAERKEREAAREKRARAKEAEKDVLRALEYDAKWEKENCKNEPEHEKEVLRREAERERTKAPVKTAERSK